MLARASRCLGLRYKKLGLLVSAKGFWLREKKVSYKMIDSSRNPKKLYRPILEDVDTCSLGSFFKKLIDNVLRVF